MKVTKNKRTTGLTLLELMVVVAILAILIALSVPVIAKAKMRAQIAKSASNLKQIHAAFIMYVGDHDDLMFWRDADIPNNGMEWFIYGGRTSGNTNHDQNNLFNRLETRPLNSYVDNNVDIFHHPADYGPTYLQGASHYDNVGNSYVFNAFGSPFAIDFEMGGLTGNYFSSIKDPASTVCFLEVNIVKQGLKWYDGVKKGNICYADGHIEYSGRPAAIGRDESDPGWGVVPADPAVPAKYWDIN